MHVSTVLVLIVGYFLGSIPFAYLLARRHRGIDLRVAGSGNVGAANLLRTTTKKIGVSAMVLDMGKGIATVLVARRVMTLMTPLTAFAPHWLAPGPLITSIRSISSSSVSWASQKTPEKRGV